MMAGSKWHDQSGAVATDGDAENLQAERETGIVEKLLNTYGFIRCCDRQARLFFHYSQFAGNIEHLKVGDAVDFEMTFDKKSGKPIAVQVSKICSDISLTVGAGHQLVNGIVTSELNADGKNGRVAYENCGECFFFEFTRNDLVDPMHDKPRHGQEVQFIITQDAAGNLQAGEVRSVHMAQRKPQQQQPQQQAPVQQQLSQQQSFIPAPLVYPGVIVPVIGSIGGGPPVVAHAFGSPATIAVPPQMAPGPRRAIVATGVVQSNGNNSEMSSLQQGGGGLNKQHSPLLNSASVHHQQQQQQQQQQSIIQHFSGQSTKQQLLPSAALEHQAAVGHGPQIPNHHPGLLGQLISAAHLGTSGGNSGAGKGQKLNAAENNIQQQYNNNDNRSSPPNSKRYQGVVCSMKESYGFVERADVVKEIFFHCSEAYQGISPGDDVSFDIAMRNNREVAVNLQRLPVGTVIFEDIENVVRRGTVTKLANLTDEPLDGRLVYENNGEKLEVGFGERDLAPAQWTMYEGDPVEFQLATDRRDSLQRATNISMAVAAPNAFAKETRLTGTVLSVRDSYGFVITDDSSEFFFKLSECLDPEVRSDSVVQFSLAASDASSGGGGGSNAQRQVAIRVCRPPAGQQNGQKVKKSLGRKSAMQNALAAHKCTHRGYVVALKEQFGFIEAENRQEDLFFHFTTVDGDVKALQVGSEVEYSLANKNQRPSADCVRAIERGSVPGIELLSDELYLGRVTRSLRCFNPDQVPYCGLVQLKPSMSEASIGEAKEAKANSSDDSGAERSTGGGDATDTNANNNSNSKQQGGSSEDDAEDDESGDNDDIDENGQEQDVKEYEFSVMSLGKAGEVMQKGDLVEFQLAKSKVTGKVIAVNVRSVRERRTATIDLVKGQVVFLNFEVDGVAKKVSFHLNEYTNKTGATALSTGDLIEFDLIRGRNNKFSATNVSRIKEKEAAPRPAALVQRIKAMTISDDGPKVIAIRQPRGPDGSRGFAALAAPALAAAAVA